MDCNINRNSLDSQESRMRNFNHDQPFQDRGMKWYRNKTVSTSDNADYRNNRSNKIKKSYKSYDDHMVNNHTHPDNAVETFPQKYFNGDKQFKNSSYNHDRKSLLNSTLNEYSKPVNCEPQRNTRRKEITTDRYIPREYKVNRTQHLPNEADLSRQEKTSIKMKFNFLQESQLNNEIFEIASDVSKDTSIAASSSTSSRKTPSIGLNPAALEFTPSGNNQLTREASSIIQQIPDAIENGLKSLNLNTENTSQTICNPIVIDSSELNYTNTPIAIFSDQSLSNNYFQNVRAGQLSGCPSYHQQQLLQQYQLAVYNAANQQQLLRYNPAHNVPINFPPSYFVYNPVNQYPGTMAAPLLTNRLVPLATADIAHQFNSYYPDSTNIGNR